eukprot:767688-Hanusia_phi.AAC.6
MGPSINSQQTGNKLCSANQGNVRDSRKAEEQGEVVHAPARSRHDQEALAAVLPHEARASQWHQHRQGDGQGRVHGDKDQGIDKNFIFENSSVPGLITPRISARARHHLAVTSRLLAAISGEAMAAPEIEGYGSMKKVMREGRGGRGGEEEIYHEGVMAHVEGEREVDELYTESKGGEDKRHLECQVRYSFIGSRMSSEMLILVECRNQWVELEIFVYSIDFGTFTRCWEFSLRTLTLFQMRGTARRRKMLTATLAALSCLALGIVLISGWASRIHQHKSVLMADPSNNQKLVNVCDLYGCHTVLVSTEQFLLQQRALEAEHEQRLRARKQAYATMIRGVRQGSARSAHLEEMALKKSSVNAEHLQQTQAKPEARSRADASPVKMPSPVKLVNRPASAASSHAVPAVHPKQEMKASVVAEHPLLKTVEQPSLPKTPAAVQPPLNTLRATGSAGSALSHAPTVSVSEHKIVADKTPVKATVDQAPQHLLQGHTIERVVPQAHVSPAQPAQPSVSKMVKAATETMHAFTNADEEKKEMSKRALIRKTVAQVTGTQLTGRLSRPASAENLGSIINSGFADKTFKKGSVQSEQPLFDRFVGMQAPLIADSRAVKLAAAKRLSVKHAGLLAVEKRSREAKAVRSLDVRSSF